MRALSSPNALKGVLTAQAAAAALARGLRSAGVEAEELPVADGGDGTADVLAGVLGGEWHTARVSDPLGRPVDARWLVLPERVAVVESAEAIGLKLLAEGELDPLRASSRGFGELILAALSRGAAELILCLGGVATVDGGAGLREVVDSFPVPTRVARDVVAPLLGPRGAAYAYGPQKGATRDQVVELEERLAAMPDLEPYASLAGAGAAGGLGAACAALGAQLVDGGELVLDALDFDARIRDVDLVVTGEGTVDATTAEGKAPAAVVRACRRAGVRCVAFGGRVVEQLDGVPTYALSGRPEAAEEDLVALGAALGGALVGLA